MRTARPSGGALMRYVRALPSGSVPAMHARANSWMSAGVRFAGLKASTAIDAGAGSVGASAGGGEGGVSPGCGEGRAESAGSVVSGSSLSCMTEEERRGEVSVEAIEDA